MGPLRFRIKMPGDPTRDLPVTVFIEVKRGGIGLDELKKLSQEIRQQRAHLVFILTDRSPHSGASEELEFLPQIVLTVVEHRDLVKLLVFSLATKRGINIDKALLKRSFHTLFEKFGLRDKIADWIERMTKAGYLLQFEGFVGDTAKACRFFINSIGRELSSEACWELSWRIRGFLPFGIDSRIIPDMGLQPLRKHVKVLEYHGFLRKDGEKHQIQKHPSEECVVELLEYYGRSATRSNLKKHFVLREAAERIFDSLLEHMNRKLLIQRAGPETVRFLTPPEIKKLRDEAVENFRTRRSALKSYKAHFGHVLTWKQRALKTISLMELEEFIEKLLETISLATDENLMRSHTFLLKELTDWYGHYVEKISLSMSKADETIRRLEAEIGNLEQRSQRLFDSLVKATKTSGLRVELQELQRAKDKTEEVGRFLEVPKSSEEIEEMKRPIFGNKKLVEENKEKLTTDVDEDIRSRGIRGDWAIAEYVLIKEEEREIVEEIDNLYKMLDSLSTLSDDLVNLTEDLSKLF